MLDERKPTPHFSVIVATRDRKASLGRFLEGLRRLPDSPSWELIVVDNGSTDGTDQLLCAASKDLRLIHLHETRGGKSRALNRAFAEATGEILLFTDDDIVPGERWLTALYDAANEFPDVNIFGGKVLVDSDEVPRWVTNSYNLKTILTSEHDLGDAMIRFLPNEYPAGPNIAVRRSLLEKKGGLWPTNLGPGTKIPVGDERAFLVNLSAPQCADRLYVPESTVFHRLGARRICVGKAVLRCFLGGFAAGMIDKKCGRQNFNGGLAFWNLALKRFRQARSAAERICILARTLGVIGGMASPYPKIIYDSSGKPRSGA